MSKYKREMDRISVADEMKERILNNVEKKAFTAPQKSFKWMRYAAVAACCCLALTGTAAYQALNGQIDADDIVLGAGNETSIPPTMATPSDGTTAAAENTEVPTMNNPTAPPEDAVTHLPNMPIESDVTETLPAVVSGIEETLPPKDDDIVLGQGGDVTTTMPHGDGIVLGQGEETTVQIPNPIRAWSSVDELKANLPFELKLPEGLRLGTKFLTILDMAEIRYVDSEANGDEILNDITYRTARGTDDISGDYNRYSEVNTVTVNGMEVTLKSNSDKNVMLAVWTDGEYSFSLSFEHGASRERVIEIIESIK